MGKVIKFIITLVILAILGFGGWYIYTNYLRNDDTVLSGRFTIVSMSDGITSHDKDYLDRKGQGNFYLEFFDNGTCVTFLWGSATDCTYVREGDRFSITDTFGTVNKSGEVDGDRVMLSELSKRMVFERQ